MRCQKKAFTVTQRQLCVSAYFLTATRRLTLFSSQRSYFCTKRKRKRDRNVRNVLEYNVEHGIYKKRTSQLEQAVTQARKKEAKITRRKITRTPGGCGGKLRKRGALYFKLSGFFFFSRFIFVCTEVSCRSTRFRRAVAKKGRQAAATAKYKLKS